MAAPIFNNDRIRELATQLTSDQIQVVIALDKAGSLMNDSTLDEPTVRTLEQLAPMGLADPANDGVSERVYVWTATANGTNLLKYLRQEEVRRVAEAADAQPDASGQWL